MEFLQNKVPFFSIIKLFYNSYKIKNIVLFGIISSILQNHSNI
jgi:hypothetical protein